MPQIAATPGAPLSDWVGVEYASDRLGFSQSLIKQLITEGVMPVLRLAGARNSSYRIPFRLVEDAYRAVMSGGQVELRDFCRTWTASNAVPEAVAS